MSELNIEVRKVTPALAREMLAHNEHNRKLNDRVVSEYARDMHAGSWHLNGEAIQIAADGTLLNGQHRLSAVILADVAVEFLVVSGLPRSAQDTIDTGRKRTVMDVLSMDGVKNAPVVASIAVRVMRWDGGDKRLSAGFKPTHTEALNWIASHPSVHRSAEVAQTTRSAFKPLHQSSAGAAHFILSRIDVGDTAEFFAMLASGAGLEPGSGILALRNRLMNVSAAGERVPDGVRLNMILRAWNAYRTGEDFRKMNITSDTKPVEPK